MNKYRYIGSSAKNINGRNIFRGDVIEVPGVLLHKQFIPVNETQRVKKFNPIVIEKNKEKTVKKPRRKK